MFQKNNKGFYEFEELNKSGLLNAVSTKAYGNIAYKYGEKAEVDKNREKFTRDVGIDFATTAQHGLIHGTQVQIVDKPGMYDNVDGLITNAKDIALWVMTGDCAPIILFDPVKKVAGLVHSGWKGTVGKISLVAITKMMTNFECNINDIIVAIGPTIEKCCYLNMRPTVEEFLPEWVEFVNNLDEEEALVDLNDFTIKQLLDIGVKQENIYWSNYCTRDHSDEFNCSQLETLGEDKPGRFATVVKIK